MLATKNKSENDTFNSPIRNKVNSLLMLKSKSIVDNNSAEKKHLEQLQKMPQRGRIELIMGPMFAGKSTELLRRIKRQEISGKKCLSVKFAADTRYSEECISTHDKQEYLAVACTQLSDLNELWHKFDVIGIDEGQFFPDIVDFSETAANMGKIVIMSALNGTFEKKGWNNILELIPLCEKIKKLSAICKICASNANFTFRETCGSSGGNELIEIGGADMYMPLCRQCFQAKTELQKARKDVQILFSESKSTQYNDSSCDDMNDTADHRALRMVSSSASCSSAKQSSLGLTIDNSVSPTSKNQSTVSNQQPSKSQQSKNAQQNSEPTSPILKNFHQDDSDLRNN